MSIRIRQIDGFGLVAICAARSIPKPGDIYLDDVAHRALGQKFARDFVVDGINVDERIDRDEEAVVDREESNNPNRKWWDSIYCGADYALGERLHK